MGLVTIKQYAEKHGKDPSAIRHLVRWHMERSDKSPFKTLQKIGSYWVIDEDEPYPENANYRHGKYVGWYAENRRKKIAKETRQNETPPET